MRESVQYHRFGVPPVAPDERFEYWRSWFGQATDAPVSIEPVGRVPVDFHSAAEGLQVGSVSFTELHFGPSIGSWQRDGMGASGLVRIAVFCRARGAVGHWYGRSVALLDGCPVLISATDGGWRAPAGMHTIAVNVPRAALPLADAAIDRIAARPIPAGAVIFESLVAPMLLGMVGRLGALARCVDAAAPNRSDLEATWLSMAALLLRSLDSGPADGVEFAPARRLQAQRFIAANLGDQHLTPDLVAQAMSISRRALYASFADGATELAQGDAGPAYSPDGSTIVYARRLDLWTMRADGSNQRNLTNNGLANDSPTFSPDGTRIAFSSTLIGGNAQVLAMPATGGAPVSLSGPDGRSAAPTWGPGTVSAPPPVAIPAPVSFKTTPNAVTLTSDRALKLRFATLPGATGTLTVSARVPAKTAAAASAASARTTRRVTLVPKRAFRASASGNVSVRVRINARRLARLPRARRRFAATLSVTIGGRTFTDSFTLRRSSRKR